jgi:hypothetical protein
MIYPFNCIRCDRLISYGHGSRAHKKGLCKLKCYGSFRTPNWNISKKDTKQVRDWVKVMNKRRYALPVKHIIKEGKVKTDPNLLGIGTKKFYETREWQTLRYNTLKKYGCECMVCHRKNIEMHVDHIKPISKFPTLALEMSNLQVLCRDCNLGKGNTDSIDWRPK